MPPDMILEKQDRVIGAIALSDDAIANSLMFWIKVQISSTSSEKPARQGLKSHSE